MEFESFIFEPNLRKQRETERYYLFVAFLFLGLFAIYWFLFSGLLSLITVFGIPISLISIKTKSDNQKGYKQWGHKRGTITITPDRIKLRDTEVLISNLQDFELDCTDYSGKTTKLILTSNGTNNFIAFKFNGKIAEFQFIVPSIKEYNKIKKIESLIESKRSPTMG